MSTILESIQYRRESQKNSGTNTDTEEYTTRLDLLYEIAQKASSYSEVIKLIEALLSVTQRILKPSAASLFLINEEKGELVFQAADGKVVKTFRQIRRDSNSGIVGWVAHHSSPVVANDVHRDKRFDKDIDEFAGYVAKSIIAVPLVRGKKVIGVLEALNTAEARAFNEQDLVVLAGFASTEALILLVSLAATALHNIKLRQGELKEHKRMVETLAAAADVKDLYACGHSQRVREYTLLAASSLSFSPEELQVIEFGALLHDIGKIGIDDCLLHKPGSLTNEEWEIMRKHSLLGANIVGEIPFLERARGIVLYHHEWYNGTGYPESLKGEDIPIGARLVAVADAFDTMTTGHSYRPALGVDEAVKELTNGSGTQFCPVAVDAFVSAFRKREGKPKNEETERATVEEAEREAEEAGKIKDAEVWRNKGIALGRLGRHEEALEALVKATELDPQSSASWSSRGTALGRLGRHIEALEVFIKAIELDPENFTARSNKVTALIRLGRNDEAKKDKEEIKRLEKEAKRAAKEKAKREVEEAKKEKDAEKMAEKEADQAAKEMAEREAKEAMKVKDADISNYVSSELYEGDVKLAISSALGFEQINQFKHSLRKVENLRIALDSWSEDEGIIIVVSLGKPMPLGSILSQMPVVEQVYNENKHLAVVLKASAVS